MSKIATKMRALLDETSDGSARLGSALTLLDMVRKELDHVEAALRDAKDGKPPKSDRVPHEDRIMDAFGVMFLKLQHLLELTGRAKAGHAVRNAIQHLDTPEGGEAALARLRR